MRLIVAGVAAVLLLSGCGSDGDDEGSLAGREATTSSSALEDTTTSSSVGETTTTAAPAAAGAPTTAARRAATATTARPQSSPTTAAASPPPPQPGTTAAPPPPPPGPPDINIQNFTFQPPVLNVGVGKTVTAKNLDSAPHTWTADDGSWDSPNLAKDQTFSHTFTKAGSFAYHCDIHPSMKGTVNVR